MLRAFGDEITLRRILAEARTIVGAALTALQQPKSASKTDSILSL